MSNGLRSKEKKRKEGTIERPAGGLGVSAEALVDVVGICLEASW